MFLLNQSQKNYLSGIVFCFVFFTILSAAHAQQLTIQPNTAYRLSFDAVGQKESDSWWVHMQDDKGMMRYEGALQNDWQKLVPEKKTYNHLFYSPASATTLQLIVPKNVSVSDIKLDKMASKNLFLNGDFTADNFSGWSENYDSHFQKSEEGKHYLKVEHNGYAFTDYTPVKGGGQYDFNYEKLKGPWASLYAYDENLRYIGEPKRITKHGSTFEMQKDAAYVRAFFKGWHDHIENYRIFEIVNASLTSSEGSVPERTSSTSKNDEDWEIALYPSSDAREEYAAHELQHWMTKITGKTPLLLGAPSKSKAKTIFIGRSWAKDFASDLKTLEGSDGFALRKKEGDVFVFGANPRGSLYGVYSLLERNTDIIWPRPNPQFDAIYTKKDRIDFSNADIVSRPAFTARHVSTAGNSGLEFRTWQGRAGLNSPTALRGGYDYDNWQRGSQISLSHSELGWIPESVIKSDPRVLSLVDGKRSTSRWHQPNYGYQGSADAIATNMIEQIRQVPGDRLEWIDASIGDNWTVSGDSDTMAPITLADGSKLTAKVPNSEQFPAFFSTRNWMMLNSVATQVTKVFPDVKIASLAYIFTAEPSRVPVNSAIIPRYAAYPTQNVRYPILSGKGKDLGNYTKDIWKRRFEKWGEIKKGELGSFGYYYVSGFNALADTASADFQALANYDAIQVHTEGFPQDTDELNRWDADAMEKWVMTKLMWDPSQDPQELRKKYIARVYYGAEAEMTEFFGLIRDSWNNAPESVFINCHTSGKSVYEELIVNQGIEDKARKLLVQAEKKANRPQPKEIIRRHLAYFNQLGNSLGRVFVPNVAEAANEWDDLQSTHWEKAYTIDKFSRVNDWRIFEEKDTIQQTKVSIMHDQQNLYIRFDGEDNDIAHQAIPAEAAGGIFPKGDHFEVYLRNDEKRKDYYFALGPGGHFWSSPPLKESWTTKVVKNDKSWTGVFSIPLEKLGTKEELETLKGRFGRVYREGIEREESSNNGSSLFNEASSLWMDILLQ